MIGLLPTLETDRLRIGRPLWGQGYATEAARRLIRFGFEAQGLNRIWARCMAQNRASARVLEKVGLRYEGTLREHICKAGVFHDLACYSLLRAEFQA